MVSPSGAFCAHRDCGAGFLAGLAAFQRDSCRLSLVPGGAVMGTPAEAWRTYSVHREPLVLWTLKLGFVAASPA